MVGGVAIAYHLPNVGQLRLSAATLADILLGRIVAWNDSRIAADNPGPTLPDLPISVITREGSTGTTYALTCYLSRMSPAWKQRIGVRPTVGWPVGCSFADDRAIAREVANTDGAIGFTALAYAREHGLAIASVENSGRQFIQPTEEALVAATEGALGPRFYDLRANLVSKRLRATAYPLSTFSYVMLPENRRTHGKAAALSDFLYWTITHGDKFVREIGYLPLPVEVRLRAVACLALLRANGCYIFHPPEIVPTADGTTIGWEHQHEVRAVQAKLVGAGASLPAPVYERSIAGYREIAPGVAIDYTATASGHGFDALFGGRADFCSVDFCPTTDEIRPHIHEDDSLVCLACGRTWNAHEPHFSCSRCGTSLLARYNAAIVTARRTQQQAVEYAQRLRAWREQNAAAGSGSEQPSS
jgi:phosphate ABC transporter phosphate-binding protein